MELERQRNTERILNNAVSIIHGSYAQYNSIEYEQFLFYKLYAFTTENITGYISKFDLNGKKVLTVGSSGDQVMNYILRGATDITVYDINIYAEYYFALKKAAILALSYKEFLQYFMFRDYPKKFSVNYKTFNFQLYKKLLVYLDEESKFFWGKLYKFLPATTIRERLFSMDIEYYQDLKEMTGYLKEQEYYILRDKIKNVQPKFIVNNIINFNTIELKEKYDFINLSNIAQYLENLFEKNYLENFERIIQTLDKKFLNKNGDLIVSYLYYPDQRELNTEKWGKIYDLDEVFKVFKKYNLDTIKFPGVGSFRLKKEIYDIVLIYRKSEDGLG